MNILELSIPSNYSVDDTESLEAYLAHYDASLNIYSGEYNAPWLISDIHDVVWQVKTKRSFKRKDGWHNALTLRWDRNLPNGTNLYDEVNRPFLTLLQKCAFIFRESPQFSIDNSLTLRTVNKNLCHLAEWMYLHEALLSPNTRFFNNLTQNDIHRIFTSYCRGGAYELLQTGEYFLKQLSIKLGVDLVAKGDPYSISRESIVIACQYFSEHGYYDENGFLKRKLLSEHLGISWQQSKSKRHTAMLRQFEPLIRDRLGDVLVTSKQDTELPSHRCPLVSDAIMASAPGQPKTLLDTLGKVFKLHSIFPKEIPASDSYDFGAIGQLIKRSTRPKGHTPWIPIETSLVIINSSLRILMTWGDDLIKFYHRAITQFTNKQWLVEDNLDEGLELQQKRNEWIVNNLPPSLKPLNVIGFSHKHGRKSIGEELRLTPTLSDLMIVYIGAICTLIGSMKPMRRQELSDLPFDCIRFVQNDGFWLVHSLAKSGVEDILPETAKPIPRVVARAIQRLQRLNRITKRYSKYSVGNPHTEYLFFLVHPSRSRNLFASLYDGDAIKRSMELFCDYVESPVDNFGRRYYVNIHELRKSFLLAFFWTFKFSSLDACRWIAGHKDSQHVFEYIEANIPGEEISDVEAEYAAQQLRIFSEDRSLSEIENIEALNQDVCRHFNVETITLVSDDDLTDWLAFAIQEGSYQIKPYEIAVGDGQQRTRIAVNIKESICGQ